MANAPTVRTEFKRRADDNEKALKTRLMLTTKDLPADRLLLCQRLLSGVNGLGKIDEAAAIAQVLDK